MVFGALTIKRRYAIYSGVSEHKKRTVEIRVILLGVIWHLIACSTQRTTVNLEKQHGNFPKLIEAVFVSYENDIPVDTSRYTLSIEDFKDSLKFEYYTTVDSTIAMSVTVNARDSLPINSKSTIVDSIQFQFDSEIDEVYKYEAAEDTIYGARSGFLWHKEYGIIAESNYSWGIRFLLAEFDGESFNENHPFLLPDSFWFNR